MPKMHPAVRRGLNHDKTEIIIRGKVRERMDAERRIEKAERVYRREKLKRDANRAKKHHYG